MQHAPQIKVTQFEFTEVHNRIRIVATNFGAMATVLKTENVSDHYIMNEHFNSKAVNNSVFATETFRLWYFVLDPLKHLPLEQAFSLFFIVQLQNQNQTRPAP